MNRKTKLNAFSGRTAFWSAAALALVLGANASAEPWKFGVMGDTQWTHSKTDPNNPRSVSVSMINQLNPQFIAAGVKFVVQVGDLCDSDDSSTAYSGLAARAAACQDLYNNGIGFFPLRGNHESSSSSAGRFRTYWPQTQGTGPNVVGAANFSSPNPANGSVLTGLSYSFDYNNVRFVLLDQFTRLSGTTPGDAIGDQVPWVNTTLQNRPAGTHGFVFSHKNVMGENHKDCLFGNPGQYWATENSFLAALMNNGVRYTFSGHDHMHQRSIIASPDGFSAVQEIICGSDSSKFYTPISHLDSGWKGTKARETSVAQDLWRVAYYIVTVDGPKVTVDYYASDEIYTDNSPTTTPTLHFNKRESFGYSLNGDEFLVPQGQFYTSVQDVSPEGAGTVARIIAGGNGSSVKDYNNRALTKVVDTGWAPANGTISDIFTLWGMTDVGANWTDAFVPSLSFNSAYATPAQIARGFVYLATKDANGNWINAVDANNGGTRAFVVGPYLAGGYPLGTFGIDTTTTPPTAWAVVNHASDFAVINMAPAPLLGDLNQDYCIDKTDLALVQTAIRVRSTNPAYDLNQDGRVDIADARWLVLHFTNAGGVPCP